MKKILRKGQIISDEKGNKYLVIRMTEKSVECLNEEWNRVDIGLAFVKYFYDTEDDLDIELIINFLKDSD